MLGSMPPIHRAALILSTTIYASIIKV